MDYPKSNPKVGLHNGKFTDGSADGSVKPSLDTADHDNALTDEILNVIRAAGLEPDEFKVDQMAEAIALLIEAKAATGYKRSCRVATTGNVVLSGLLVVDGVQTVAGDRVLVKAQAAGTENGIYVAAAGAWVRATDADEGAEISHGALIPVEEGAQNANSLWMVATDGTVTIGVTALAFERVGADALPIGCVVGFSGSVAPPGYLIANGAAVARATYAQLDAAMYVGDAANATAAAWYRCSDAGNPTGTRATNGAFIVLPDYRGLHLRGLDLGRGIDAGRGINTWQRGTVHSFDAGVAGSVVGDRTASTAVGGVAHSDLGLDYDPNIATSYPAAIQGNTNASAVFSALANTAEVGSGVMRPHNVALLLCIKAFSASTNQGLIDITALANEVNGKLAVTALGLGLAGASGYLPIPYRDASTGEIKRLLLQWGVSGAITLSNNAEQLGSPAITWPIAFPNGVLRALAHNGSARIVSTLSSVTKTGAVVDSSHVGASGQSATGGCEYIVIGY